MTEPIPSPMGSYDAQDAPSSHRRYEIRMLAVPVELFVATRQQHDELMREFAVLALAHEDEEISQPQELRRLVRELGIHHAGLGFGTDERVDAASHAGKPTIDVTYTVTVSVLAATERLEALLQSADEFCLQGRMLTMPRTPQMRRFAGWWWEELRRQVDGNEPTPWVDA